MSKPKIAVLKTSPQTVVDDYGRLLKLADYEDYLPKDKLTHLKINISWHVYYPACSTAPWQLDGVLKQMTSDGYSDLVATHNRTVVVDDRRGQIANKHSVVEQKYKLGEVHLNEPGTEWIVYKPKSPMLCLEAVYPKGILIPKRFIGTNIIHFPTMKTHVFTTTTGAMKNAFGGLLNQNRHWTHSRIHETLVDLLAIQKEIHTGIFAVMDGTIAGDGPGPRAMVPYIKDYILAGNDQVAIDAVASKMMGFDPMSLDYIRLAHERGLGCGDIREIEIAGDDITNVNFGFHGKQETFASRGQKMIYHGPLKPLEHFLLRTPIAGWSFVASKLYHDGYWYRAIGKRRVAEIMKTEWGRLFESY